MDEVRLKIRKRAVKSRGRARLHESMLAKLGVQEESKLEIINDALSKSVTVTLFADSMVEEGYIRLSEEDLEALGLKEEDTVVIRRKPPISERMKETAEEVSERVSKGVEEVGERAEKAAGKVSERLDKAGEAVKKEVGKVRTEAREAADTVKRGTAKAYGRIVEEAAPVTERIESATKETVTKLKEGVTPTTEKAEGKAREVYARIVEEIPGLRERFSKAAEPVVNRLKPDEGAKLTQALEGCQGSIQTVTVTSDTVADQLIKDLELPSEVVISAVQRNKEIVIPKGDTRLVKGDIVYLVGKEESIRECQALLEG